MLFRSCRFQYEVGNTVFTGQAESLDFRFFPTGARLDAQVAQLSGKAITARVDPAHPTYAWALIDSRWFVPYTFGPFELMVMVLLAGVLPIAFAFLIRRNPR